MSHSLPMSGCLNDLYSRSGQFAVLGSSREGAGVGHVCGDKPLAPGLVLGILPGLCLSPALLLKVVTAQHGHRGSPDKDCTPVGDGASGRTHSVDGVAEHLRVMREANQKR